MIEEEEGVSLQMTTYKKHDQYLQNTQTDRIQVNTADTRYDHFFYELLLIDYEEPSYSLKYQGIHWYCIYQRGLPLH